MKVGARAVAVLLALGALAGSGVAHAATIVVNDKDGAGEGFNDPSPFTPVGGNAGATRGEARLLAFQYAASLWAARLASPVTIQIDASMDPQTCSATLSQLGQAGPTSAHRNFPSAPLANTWYPQALANALSGVDLKPDAADARAAFNSTIDNGTCSGIARWYYGLDGHPPAGTLDFVSTVFHEIGHSLGFQIFVDLTTGAKLADEDDVFERRLEQHGAVPPDYPSMTNSQRVAASVSGASLQWTGPATTAAGLALLSAGIADGHVRMYAPNPQQPGSSVAHFATQASPNQLLEPFDTGPIHDPGLALQVLQDIGWPLQAATSVTALSAPMTLTLAIALLTLAAPVVRVSRRRVAAPRPRP